MEIYLIFGLVALLLIANRISFSPRSLGAQGESYVNAALRRRLNKKDYLLLKDLTLPAPGGTTQIDHIVISRHGIFVIETKNMSGWIFGSAAQKRWTQIVYRRKSRFQNPVLQNFKHVKTVQDLLGIKADRLHNIVVFVGPAVPKTAMPANVIWGVHSLTEYIKAKRPVVFNENDPTDFAERLSEAALKPGIRTRRTHVKNIKTRLNDKTRCPRCRAEMVERTNKQTGNRFLGCSRYPRCTGTRNLP